MNSSLISERCSTHLNPFTGNFGDTDQPYKEFISKYLGHGDSSFLSQFLLYLLLVFTYLLIEWLNLPLIPFSSIINISITANNSNFSLALPAVCQTNLGNERNFAGSTSKISKHFF